MRVGRKAAGRTRRAFRGPCPSEDGGVDRGPSQVPLKGPRVGRARKVREEARKTTRAFSGFEAEPGKAPHQPWFGRHRAFAKEALHANLAAGGGSAATGTRRRSHPGRDLGGSVAPWRLGNRSCGAFPRHGETVSGREAP